MKKILLLGLFLSSLFANEDYSYLKKNKQEMTDEQKDFYLKSKDMDMSQFKQLNNTMMDKETFLKENNLDSASLKKLMKENKYQNMGD